MNRRKLIKSLSGGAVALWGGSLLDARGFAQTKTTTTTTDTTTTPTTTTPGTTTTAPTEPNS
jgi:hypothetical protein